MVCQSKVALLASLCCIFPGAHSALSGKSVVAPDPSTSTPASDTQLVAFFDPKFGETLDDSDKVSEWCETISAMKKTLTDTELATSVRDFNEKITSLLGETANYLEETDIPLAKEAAIKERINAASRLVIAFPGDPKKLVLAVIETEAKTLLDLLRVTFIWRSPLQYHWFNALLSHSGFEYKGQLHREYEESHPLNWRNNFSAICEVDDEALAKDEWEKIMEEISGEASEWLKEDILRACARYDAVKVLKALELELGQLKRISGEELEEFKDEILRTCARYDAVKVFEALKFEPSQLGKYFELMKNYKSTKLCKMMNEDAEKQQRRHLETLILPGSVEELDSLLRDPSNSPRMDWIIEKCCEEGRLGLLEHLGKLHQALMPSEQEILIAAKNKREDVVEWAYHNRHYWSGFMEEKLSLIGIKLAVDGYAKILEFLLKECDRVFSRRSLASSAVEVGALNIIEQIHRKYPTAFEEQAVIDKAAKHKHLPVLKWLNAKFNLLPTIEFLEHSTVEILDWMKGKLKDKDETLDYEALLGDHADNFNVLRWIHKEAPSFEFSDKRKKQISKAICTQEDMIWAHNNLKIQPKNMNWACSTSDLEAIESAIAIFNHSPKTMDLAYAISEAHFHIIKWAYGKFPESITEDIDRLVKTAVGTGNLKVADYLMKISPTIAKQGAVQINLSVTSQHLNVLKWVHEHPFIFDMPSSMNSEIEKAVKNESLDTLQWIDENIITVNASPKLRMLAVYRDNEGHPKIYKWLLEKYLKGNQQSGLDGDFQLALNYGNLKIAEMILEKVPSLSRKKFTFANISSWNYLAMRWLKAKEMWSEPQK